MMKILKALQNVWISDNTYVKCDVKVRDHCFITANYRGAAHRDCNINFSLNFKALSLFHDLKIVMHTLLSITWHIRF